MQFIPENYNRITKQTRFKNNQRKICELEKKLMIVRAVIERYEEAQAYSATCPELNFVSSFGETKEKALANLEDAIKLMLEPILNF